MADPVTGEMPPDETEAVHGLKQSRKEKRKILKKLKRKQIRTEEAIKEREEEESRLNDPEQLLILRLQEQEQAEKAERDRKEFEERERLWLEAAAARKAHEEEYEQRKKLLEEEERKAQKELAYGLEADDEYEYVDEGPAEIIWQGNEIIVKKKRVKVAKKSSELVPDKEDDDRPTSNPLPPQSAAFTSYLQGETVTAHEVLDSVAQQVPNFGTEQDKAHCPFHLKTGACRFGSRCSRAHFYPDKSCTLLIKNMYNGPGLTCEQDEGLEYTDEEIERCYEEFYEDVHTEFLKFGEIVNFKVCKNSSYHLRGNLYVHYKSLESAILAYNTMNARYYAGKQIICEFIGVTRWKVAICGEYIKSRLKTCSHGSACNFIHCFRNPGGDYEWADWDNPPPRYWNKEMFALFGTSVESYYDKELESEDYKRHREQKRMKKLQCYRNQSERSHYKEEMDLNINSFTKEHRRHESRHESADRSSISSRRKRREELYNSEEKENPKCKLGTSISEKKENRKQGLNDHYRERGSFSRNSYADLYSERDSSAGRYNNSSHFDKRRKYSDGA